MSHHREAHLLRPWIAVAIVVAIAVLLHQTIGRYFGDYVERIAIDAGIAVILAVSLNIVNGYTGQFSIGHAAFYAIGGYTAGLFTYYGSLLLWNHTSAVPGLIPWNIDINLALFHLRFTTTWGPNYLIQQQLFVGSIIVGGLVSATAGWLVGLPSLRLRGDYLAIVTLGFGEILRVLLQQTNSQLYTKAELHDATFQQLFPPPVGGALGFINIPKVTTLFWVVLFAGVTLIVAWRLKRSTFGRSMIAIRENEIAAEAMGVNITRLKVWAFVFAAFFAGIAGALYAHEPGTQISPSDGSFLRSFDIVIMVVLGGLGSISGAAIAAVLLTVANEWLRGPTHVWHVLLVLLIVRLIVWPEGRLKSAIWWLSAIIAIELARWLAIKWGIDLGEYRMIIYALTLISMMILRPDGLFGTAEITDLFSRRRAIGEQPRGFEVMT